MLKTNWTDTTDKFDRFWGREKGLKLIVADVSVKAPSYRDTADYADYEQNLRKHLEFFAPKSFHGEAFPDLAPYIGPGSLATLIGSEPVYSEATIWFSESKMTLQEIKETCDRLIPLRSDSAGHEYRWYKWAIDSARYYKNNSNGVFRASMPDFEQNLDILSAVMGPQRLLMELLDNPTGVRKTMDSLYLVWEKVFDEVTGIIMEDGYTAYTHYNLLGRGTTSVLQSDISCMLSEDMFDEFELPYLRMQAEKLDNVIYHLDGPGAVRHLDSLLRIENINTIQWVPGAGAPGNADEMYHAMYERIIDAGKGLYVFLNPEEIPGFIKRFPGCRALIRTRVGNEEEQLRLIKEFS